MSDDPSAKMRKLIEQSSLGTPEAKALRDTISDEQVAKVMKGAAEISLANIGPGGICEDCGHFATRHLEGKCYFPPESRLGVNKYKPCACAGMLWEGQRVDMKKVIDIATGTNHD